MTRLFATSPRRLIQMIAAAGHRATPRVSEEDRRVATYFFNITEGGRFVADMQGIEFADLAAVEQAAVASAGALMAEAVGNGEHDYRARFDVEDEDGTKVFALAFACSIAIETPPALVRPGQADRAG